MKIKTFYAGDNPENDCNEFMAALPPGAVVGVSVVYNSIAGANQYTVVYKDQASNNSGLLTKDFLTSIIERFGRDVQIQKIQEEALELALVLNQLNCPAKDKEAMEANLYDELADMKIMIAQSELLFDVGRINARVEYKLQRFRDKYLK